MLRELRGAITALAVVLCGVLLAVSVDFGIPGQALLQSLRFHIAAALLGLVLLLFLGGAWRRGVLFLLAFMLSAGQGAAIVYRQQETRISAEAASRPLFRLLSFNLLSSNQNGKAIADFILGSGADIVLLMEASPIAGQLERLRTIYPYKAGCIDGEQCGGVVMLSKTSLQPVSVTSLGPVWRNRLVTAGTTIGGQNITVIAAHLVKPYFDEFADEELERLAERLSRLEGPMVLAGDFNAAAWSNSIDNLAWQAKLIPGPTYPATWPVALGPLGVPIDNVFTRMPLSIARVRSLDDAMGSNHRGLMAEISLATGN